MNILLYFFSMLFSMDFSRNISSVVPSECLLPEVLPALSFSFTKLYPHVSVSQQTLPCLRGRCCLLWLAHFSLYYLSYLSLNVTGSDAFNGPTIQISSPIKLAHNTLYSIALITIHNYIVVWVTICFMGRFKTRLPDTNGHRLRLFCNGVLHIVGLSISFEQINKEVLRLYYPTQKLNHMF